jgi:hypothetical protein
MRVNQIDEEELQLVYQWVDSISLSRPKKNISRDFSDGGSYCLNDTLVLMAEMVHHFIPRIVDLHNYISTSNVSQKEYNWTTLNVK